MSETKKSTSMCTWHGCQNPATKGRLCEGSKSNPTNHAKLDAEIRQSIVERQAAAIAAAKAKKEARR